MGSKVASTIVGVAIIVGAGGGVARAQLIGPGGVMHGCVSRSGALRVVGVHARCGQRQRSVIIGGDQNAAVASLRAQVSALQSANSALARQVNGLTAVLAGVTRSGNTVVMSGVNLQIDSGAGATNAPVNGLGNLIIGYDRNAGAQTGSNNLIVGDGHSATSYGGLVAGLANTISAPYATVTGGARNTSAAQAASVSGGQSNLAADPGSSITAGCDNLTGTGTPPSGSCPATGAEGIAGGASNIATGVSSSVAGGFSNQSQGVYATILGGCANTAGPSATHNSCNGGQSQAEAIAGGISNAATGYGASVAGGLFATASGQGSSVLGGSGNHATGDASAILGGGTNTANATGSAILGGSANTTSNACEAIPTAPINVPCL